MLAELAEGFREVRTRAWLWVTVVVFALAVPVGYAPLYVLGPTIAEETYDSTAVFGVVTASYGAGALAGRPDRLPLAAAPPDARGVPGDRRLAGDGRAFAIGAPVALVVPLAVATGMGFALFDVFWNTTMAEQIPPHALSRASAWEWMGSLILLPVGYLPPARSPRPPAPETVLVGGAILTAAVLGAGPAPARDPDAAPHAGARFPRVARFGPGIPQM